MSLVDLGKRLLEAAKQGDTEEVRQLMTNGAPFTTDWLGTSPLHMAAQYGYVETAEVLLRAGISRDARTKVDRTPLHIASQEGHLEIVELLLKHGADIEAKDMLKMTSLHWAVERSHLDVISCLLKYGANAAAASKFFKTPSDIAIDNCRHDLVALLGEHFDTVVRIEDNNINQREIKPIHMPLNSPNNRITPIILKHPIHKATNAQLNKTNSENAKKMISSVKLKANFQKIETVEKILPISEEIDSDSSSTSVLATLAALAEATASNSALTNTDTLQWLESHGITMLPNDNSTIVTSAVESGQTISLTEAGKLALNWVKDNPANSKTQDKRNITIPISKSGISLNPRVYTIVTEQSQIPSIIGSGQNTPIMVVSSNDTGKSELVQTYTMNKDGQLQQNIVENNEKTVSNTEENERETLREELEAMRKQAEEYRVQLQVKEHEAEQYKKQLEQMQAVSPK